MVQRQLRPRGIHDERVLEAMQHVPRHEFVPLDLIDYAYDDRPLPLSDGQTISQPYIVALTLEAARIVAADIVLDVGTGSGYAAAVAAELASRVVSIERQPRLAASARDRLSRLGYTVTVIDGDGSVGWPDGAPYDAIVAAATGPSVPVAWVEQLAPAGRIVMPIGSPRGAQRLAAFTLTAAGTLREKNLGAVSFVPLVGAQAWPEQGDA